MEYALLIVVGIACLPLTGLGIRSMFAPAGMADAIAIAPQGPVGLNTVRGVLGGLFLACAGMLVLGIASGQVLWFLAVAIVMGVVIVGRVVGIVADGFHKAVVPPLVVEIVIGGVLVTAYLLLSNASFG